MTFPARLTTQHTLKYTAIALDMAEPAKLLPTGRDAAPQGPTARVVMVRTAPGQQVCAGADPHISHLCQAGLKMR